MSKIIILFFVGKNNKAVVIGVDCYNFLVNDNLCISLKYFSSL